MANITRAEQIIRKQEALALDLLESVKDSPLPAKLDVFQQMTNWVKVKSKLEDDDGGGIADYKRRLAGEAVVEPRRKRGETGGAALERFKSRLPAADVGDDDDDRGAAGSEDAAAA